MLSAGFEPTIPASEWPQNQALDRAAIGIGRMAGCLSIIKLYGYEENKFGYLKVTITKFADRK
jgi:hypothetical protein